jgi:hypothetical protein
MAAFACNICPVHFAELVATAFGVDSWTGDPPLKEVGGLGGVRA